MNKKGVFGLSVTEPCWKGVAGRGAISQGQQVKQCKLVKDIPEGSDQIPQAPNGDFSIGSLRDIPLSVQPATFWENEGLNSGNCIFCSSMNLARMRVFLTRMKEQLLTDGGTILSIF